MSVRTIVGAWTPKDTATDKMVWLWDVSEIVKEPKDYEAEYTPPKPDDIPPPDKPANDDPWK